MQIYRLGSDISQMPKLKNTAVALGRFDAVHRGHMRIIGEAVSYAKKNNLKSVVFMFENDPSEIISGKAVPEINTQKQREKIMEELGVDIVVVKTFDREIMELDCKTFIRVYLVELFGAVFASAGFNYRFGMGGAGDVDVLRDICASYGISVSVVDEVSDGGTISSTRIRKLISDGDMETAKRLLGRYFKISGVVMHGNRLGGKIIGFPTANIEIPKNAVVPKFGVYVSVAHIMGDTYSAITNVGSRPTVNELRCCIETHIDGYFGELYGETIDVEFCGYIREIKKFDSTDALARQLTADRELSRKYFENNYNKKAESPDGKV